MTKKAKVRRKSKGKKKTRKKKLRRTNNTGPRAKTKRSKKN
jgi:hypothetical protein